MVTAKGEEVDRVVGFEVGADDYVVKPYSVRELLLRVGGMLKRSSKEKDEGDKEVLAFEDLKIDTNKHKVYLSDKKIKYNHFIWHLFVLVASVCHYISIYFYI